MENNTVNILIGPPANKYGSRKMMSAFFLKEGRHIVCGGTSASVAAAYLKMSLYASVEYEDKDIPPLTFIDGVDLVTEGVITLSRVLVYAKDYLKDNIYYAKWKNGRDGASLICHMLIEEAADINFFVGMAVNPAHQKLSFPINFNQKMKLADELAGCLKKMGKKIEISFF